MYFDHIHLLPTPPRSNLSSLPTNQVSSYFFQHQVQIVLPIYSYGFGIPLECGPLTRGNILKVLPLS